MGEIVTALGHEIQAKEYRGQRVVTFKDIDTVHERPEGTAGRNFITNRNRFVSSVDFFKVSRKELPTNFVANSGGRGNPNNDLILMTESGYLMLVKSFTDDLAWQVQRELVDGYFRSRQVPQVIPAQPKPVIVTDTETLLRVAEITSGLGLVSQTIKVLQKIVPDLAESNAEITMEDPLLELTTKNVESSNGGFTDPFDSVHFKNFLYRKKIGLRKLSELSGISTGQLSTYRSGKTKPGKVNREKITKALGLETGYFDHYPQQYKK